jgi:short-subunit dehydrogenase
MKRTLITGASTGLGKELAKLYALDNNDLILVARNETKLNEVKNEILKLANVKCDILVADLSIKEEWEKVYNYTKDKGYFVNNLVNNAGFGDRTDFLEMDIDFQIKMTEVNCNSALYLTRMFLPPMVEHNEGHIINVASIAGFMPGPFMATYHATKGYLLLLGEAISYELRKTKVKLLTLCPGPFNSEFVSKAHNDYTFKKIKPIEASEVAKYGYKKSLQGKSVAIVGFKNKLTVFATRFAPRSFVTKTSAKTMKKGA